MSARPGEWHLIVESGTDPVPGDPDAVASEAKYYAGIAQTINEQSNRLRSMATGNTLVGKYSKTLVDKAGELADQLQKTHGRYAAVGSALNTYQPELDYARRESWGALTDAVTASGDQASANAMTNPKPASGQPLTDAQKLAQQNRTNAINGANTALSKARTRLTNALNALTGAGSTASKAIHGALHDGLKDSFWDSFAAGLVKFLKIAVEIIGDLATICALLGPLCPILELVAIGLTALSLAIHIGLALTGNGSWMDVIVDGVALATMGAGRVFARGAEEGVTATRSAARAYAERQQSNFTKLVGRVGEDAAGSRPIRYGVAKGLAKAAADGTTKVEKLAFGSEELAKSVNAAKSFADSYPLSSSIARGTSAVTRLGAKNAAAFWSAGLVDITNKAASKSDIFGGSDTLGLPTYSQDYTNVKDALTFPNQFTVASGGS